MTGLGLLRRRGKAVLRGWKILCLVPALAVSLRAEQQSVPAQAEKPDLRPQLVVGTDVFQDLTGTGLVQEAGPRLEWRFAILENNAVNAYSDAKGHVWVAGGLAQLLGEDRGLWAAVLSHEIAHVLLRHPSLALKGLHLALPYVFGKVLRDREHRADATGMMLMARAGYHPDSVFALQHLLRQVRGEMSKPLAFFSSHPRWQTREERSLRVYQEALAEFERLWPEAGASPGGPAPLLVFLGTPQTTFSGARAVAVRVPLYCRNARGPVTLTVSLEGGELRKELRRESACLEQKDGVVNVKLDESPAASRRNFKARVAVYGADGRLRAQSRRFDLRGASQ